MQGKGVKGRMLIIADGATSKLATKLGYCVEPAKGVCSRAYIKGGTHNCDFDGNIGQIYHLTKLETYTAVKILKSLHLFDRYISGLMLRKREYI